MDEIYNQLVKMGPGWTMFLLIGSAAASVIFIVGNKQYKKLTVAAHAEQLRLKEDANVFLRERLSGLESERNTYREKSHEHANTAQRLALELTEIKSRPNVDGVVAILKEFRTEQQEYRKGQQEATMQILNALEQLHKKIIGSGTT